MRDHQPSRREEELDQPIGHEVERDDEAERKERLRQRADGILHEELGAGSEEEIAASGLSGGGDKLPHFDAIQEAFGRHDVSSVRAHVGGKAAEAAGELGAEAYAAGADVAFASTPDLHTAAHEAAHTVQQLHGVGLSGGRGEGSDFHERHADQVADAVVRGQSAEGLLDSVAARGAEAVQPGAVQRKAIQRKSNEELTGRMVGIQMSSDGVLARYNRGTGAGVEPGWSVRFPDGSEHKIQQTTARESVVVIDSMTFDQVRAKGREVTFVPVSKSRKERRLERRAETLTLSARATPTMTNKEGERPRTKVRIERGSNQRFNWYWTVHLLNLDGTPRMKGEIVEVEDEYSRVEFPIHSGAFSRDTQIRLTPYQ